MAPKKTATVEADRGRPPPGRRIFANRNLRMDCIHAVGFDMDYTLARYSREHLERLAHHLTLERLVQSGYSEAILQLAYDPRFVIRGLVVDKQLGNILKLDRHSHVSRAFHGKQPLTHLERRSLYRRERLTFAPPRFALVDTLFNLPEVNLFAELVAFFERQENDAQKPRDFVGLFDDVRRAIDGVHRNGQLKPLVKQDFARYIEKDPMLALTLRKLRSSGKKLFIVTNSHWDYTGPMMAHLLDGALPDFADWTHYFDAIVTASDKPDFFVGQTPLVSLGNGAPKKVLVGGNLKALEAYLGHTGEEILYVGDHIYGDILRSKKTSLWRTGLIVEELEEEIGLNLAQSARYDELSNKEQERIALDDQLNSQRANLTRQGRLLAPGDKQQRERTKKMLDATHAAMRNLEGQIADASNPYWGMVFKEDHHNSRFGEQVVDYACLYTSRVTNFIYYSSLQYFRSPRDIMPHEHHTSPFNGEKLMHDVSTKA